MAWIYKTDWQITPTKNVMNSRFGNTWKSLNGLENKASVIKISQQVNLQTL